MNHYLLKNATPISQQSWTYGRLYDTGLGYPAIKESEREKVYGELYAVSETQLHLLDELEDYDPDGTDNLYIRKQKNVFYDNEEKEAYVYIIAEQNESFLKHHIPSGDWKQSRSQD